ncbi:MAG: HipA N-terminal domain-containing protein [Hahellaceae bacterium]|nr:HipA N-terminal domain-containing protein [Hahellaceae bacterium]
MKAYVYLDTTRVGILEKRSDHTYRFTYEKRYLDTGLPISLSLPLREDPYDSPTLHGYFSGLLAEGWLRKLQSESQKIDPTDEFALLLRNGGDLPGAVVVKKVDDA